MRLSTRSRYGARMVLDMALYGNAGLVRLSDLAVRLDVSVKYLEKLVRELQKAGYVYSKRGPTGGHGLARDVAEISVGEVVRLLEGDHALTMCAQEDQICRHVDDCIMRKVWTDASEAMFAALDAVTFADLVREAKDKQFSCDFSIKKL
ncbi:Rrf2 family transcriptional regulator [Desulfocurvibacter africanus]|uniref:Transcriptional regulator, BadM/Rrf2 family n=1 Tax=Desulfocurvibacter africanus subsp. africanus str. Walvis Bay TaxID=690850 RepID=F3Z0R6_DESAF|nr:Rrf2 family transcriptional regulator [Desulfocurvibacter africanus]EGJ49890.1 transcriptional regulator, BadM/Rrf2 family [Desulfocurvibacter africanus subsp. africanus str. Walvis Bay]